jgi:hypothetical protein
MSTAVAPIYLFLDFDGVLHSIGESPRLFEHADRLGTVLKAFPEVRVVISSSWREIHPLDELRAFCGPILGARVIDAIPVFRRVDFEKPRLRLRTGGRAPVLRRAIDVTQPFYQRFEEISAWLALCSPGTPHLIRNAIDRDDWIAIDDWDVWFPPQCSQLIHVAGEIGLGDAHFAELERHLIDHRHRSG